MVGVQYSEEYESKVVPHDCPSIGGILYHNVSSIRETKMSYKLEVAPAGDITSVVNEVNLLWTQLPNISWGRVQRELMPWYDRMAKYGMIIASRYDFDSEGEMEEGIENSILRFTEKDDLIVDPFCGSSTVGFIALMLGRNYFGCDISQIRIDESEVRLSGYSNR